VEVEKLHRLRVDIVESLEIGWHMAIRMVPSGPGSDWPATTAVHNSIADREPRIGIFIMRLLNEYGGFILI
jgi:hypothetical protein